MRGIDDAVTGVGLTILSVEDDVLVAMGTAAILEDLGHRVIEANCGRTALEKFGERPDIDLLVSDQGMPGLTGVELAEAARALRPGLPVVLVTGYHTVPGAEGLVHLHKPFRAKDMEEAIGRALAQSFIQLESKDAEAAGDSLSPS